MKFLPVCIILVLLACLSISVTVGNLRTLQASNCFTFDEAGNCAQCIPRTVNIGGQCKAVSDQCRTWNLNTGDCTACYLGYTLSNGACIIPTTPTTPTGPNTPNEPTNATTPTVPTTTTQPTNATTPTGPTNITDLLCFLFQNGTCIECVNRAFLKDGACQEVGVQCREWDSTDGSCTACYEGYILESGACNIIQISNITNDPYCNEFHANGTCLKCVFRSILVDGVCNEVSVQCREWDQIDGLCTACYKGYILQAGACKIIQSANNTIDTPYCLQFDQNAKCVKCIFRSILKDGQCLVINDLCREWNSNDATCTACYKGYKLESGTCIYDSDVFAGISLCRQQANGTCIRCAFRSVLINGICQEVSPQCRDWDQTNGQCTTCYKGYKLEAGKCNLDINGSPAIDLCAKQINGICTQCAVRAILVNGTCQEVNRFCREWNPTDGLCTSCYEGYRLLSGSCELDLNAISIIGLCAQITNGVCTKCSFRSVLINGTCQEVNTQCREWNPTDGLCTSCYRSYILVSGLCELDLNSNPIIDLCAQIINGACTKCSFRSVLINGTCQEVNTQCRDWNQTDGLCTSCYRGYRLVSGACEYDPTAPTASEPIPLCASQINGTCVKCANRAILRNNLCQPVNDTCREWDPTNGICTSCYAGYILESGLCNNDPTYQDPYCALIGANGLCETCAVRSILLSNGRCLLVNDLCRTWNPNTADCTGCYGGYNLVNGTCII